MDAFLTWSRQAFRAVHKLPPDGAAGSVPPEEPHLLLAWARRHRLLGLLRAGLPEMGQDLQTAAYGQAQHTARCTLEAERIFAHLSPSLPTLALVKGPALAVQAWPDPGLRSFDDLDFLCDGRNFHGLLESMASAGYTPKIGNPRRRALLWHYGWGLTFLKSSGDFTVEINHRFFRPQYPWPRTMDIRTPELFIPSVLQETAVRVPNPELHLLLSCLHAIWHGWARLAWLADIAGLLVRHPGAYAKAEAQVASHPFARRALADACGVADAIFGPIRSDAILPQAPEAVLIQALDLLGRSGRTLVGRELERFHEQFMTRPEIASYRLRRLWIPGDGDFRRIALPMTLRGIYWILRPLRGALSGPSRG